jgi:hypothetical protein
VSYLLSILALAALCALWAASQLWLNKTGPARDADGGTPCSSCPHPCDQVQQAAEDN